MLLSLHAVLNLTIAMERQNLCEATKHASHLNHTLCIWGMDNGCRGGSKDASENSLAFHIQGPIQQ